MNPYTLNNLIPQEVFHILYSLNYLSLTDILFWSLAIIGGFRVFTFAMNLLVR